MRVAITVPWGGRLGGAENMLWMFLRHVDRFAIDMLVIFLEEGPFRGEVGSVGIRTEFVPAGRLHQPMRLRRAVLSLARTLRREQPDLILNWAPKTQLYGAAAAIIAGMSDRVAWWQHGIPAGHWLDRAATALPAIAVGCSSHASARAQRVLWPHRPTFVVHPGIDPPQASRAAGRRIRAELGIADGNAVIGIVGRLQPWKGQHRVIRAAAELQRRGYDVALLVVGGTAYGLSPDYEPQLHRLVHELNLDDRVWFTGQVADAAPYMSAMDIFVSASEAEPFGIVLLEAMALGVPVVAADVGGPPEFIQHEWNGLLVPPGDGDALVEIVARILSDSRLAAALSTHALESARDWSAERMSRDLTAVLQELAEQRTISATRGHAKR
jgi:glycosyltransferase involved in cell wall biosynthesis